MANIDQQLGLRPIRSPYGTVPRITQYTRSTTGVIYEGAVLSKLSTGPVVYNGTTAAQGYNILGVAAHYVAADETKLLVYDHPDQEYVVQGDANNITTAANLLEATSKYCNLVSNTVGNTTTLQSKAELDTSEVTGVAAAHDVVQLVRFHTDPSNDVTAINEKWVVKLVPNVQIWTSGRTMST